MRDPARHRHPRVAAGGQPRGIFSRQSLHQTRLLTCWCLRGLTPSIRLGRLDFCPWQSSIFRQSPTFMLKIRRRLDAHEPHELPCYGLTQKLHGRVTNPAYLCTRSTYETAAAVVCRVVHLACWCTCPPSRFAYAGSASFQFHCRIHEVSSLKNSRCEFTAEFTVGFVSLQNHACTEGLAGFRSR